MQRERVQADEQAADQETEQEDDETPELVASEQRKQDHQPDAYPTGYSCLVHPRRKFCIRSFYSCFDATGLMRIFTLSSHQLLIGC